MSNNEAYGPALHRFLEREWKRLGTNPGAWCNAHPGLYAATIDRWKGGTEPRLHMIRLVADALDRPILDVLVAAGIVTEAESKGYRITDPAPPSFLEAVERDPALSDRERAMYRQMREGFAAVMAGEAERATGDTASPKVRKSSRRVTKR